MSYIDRHYVNEEEYLLRDSEAVHTSELLDLVYPVDSIYISVGSTNPALLFGGTWERISDKFLLAAGETYSAGSSGGSANATLVEHTHPITASTNSAGAHTHTANSAGSHYHSMGNVWSDGAGNDGTAYAKISKREIKSRNTLSAGAHTHTTTSNGDHVHTINASAATVGEDGVGKNMPPYLAVYVWKRTQ